MYVVKVNIAVNVSPPHHHTHTLCCLLNNSCLEHLLDNGADPSMVNSKGYSAVHYAAYHGNKQNLELVCNSVFVFPVLASYMC